MRIRYCCVSRKGLAHARNEDSFCLPGHSPPPFLPDAIEPILGCCVVSDGPVFAVFDGIGGEESGGVAARIASETAARFAFTGADALERYCAEANRRVCAWAAERGILSTGTACALARLDGDGAHACGLGDCRILHWRRGRLRQLTRDHAMSMPGARKPVLTQYLGIPEDELHLEPCRADLPLLAGDRLLLCTDGLTDAVDALTISAALAADAETAARRLLLLALESDGQDDVTIIVCVVEAEA